MQKKNGKLSEFGMWAALVEKHLLVYIEGMSTQQSLPQPQLVQTYPS